MYRQLYPHCKSTKFFERIFNTFDLNQDNFLDFGEFLNAIKNTMNGDMNEKLKCAFQIYDLKGDGKLDRHEMKKILKYIYDALGEERSKKRSRHLTRRYSKAVKRKVDVIFKEFDQDQDDFLSLDEFIQGLLKFN
jgi:Ca2+-binding EF-hand superfamily protein